MGGGEFVSPVAYGLGHVSQFSAPNKDAVMDMIETAVTEAYEEGLGHPNVSDHAAVQDKGN